MEGEPPKMRVPYKDMLEEGFFRMYEHFQGSFEIASRIPWNTVNNIIISIAPPETSACLLGSSIELK